MTVGGSAMGVLGMLVFIPLCSVLYALIKEEVHVRLERKQGRSGRNRRDRTQTGSRGRRSRKPGGTGDGGQREKGEARGTGGDR